LDDLAPAPQTEERTDFVGLRSLPYLSAVTSIATEDGPIPAGWLRAGDLVVTRDHGLQPVLAVGRVEHERHSFLENPATCPVRIEPDVLGANLPVAPMIVSPGQRILMRGAEVQLNFGLSEALVAAAHLVGWPGVDYDLPQGTTTGYQILFERHEMILADGPWTESLYLNGESLRELRREDPGLLRRFGGHRYLARPELSGWEASLLLPPHDWVGEPVRITA
jgi:hypothetical protein